MTNGQTLEMVNATPPKPPATNKTDSSAAMMEDAVQTDLSEPSDQNCSRVANAQTTAGLANRLEHLSVSPPRRLIGIRDSTPPSSRGGSTSLMTHTAASPVVTDVMKQSPQSLVSGVTPTASGKTPPGHSSPSVPNNQQQQQLGRPTPTRGFDLTPVIRNTSSLEGRDSREDRSKETSAFTVVSPDDGQFPGQHLSFPSNFAGPTPSSGPSLPPLSSHRAKSAGHLDLSSVIQFTRAPANGATTVPPPLDLPSSRKNHTFTSRKQYEQHLPPTAEHGETLIHQGLTPYQPTRADLVDVGSLPEDEVSRIFITRMRSNKDSNNPMAPVPLDERQWSIPSIRMANHLNGSVTSYTTCTEEDDLIIHGNDDDTNSLSSRGSLFLPESLESCSSENSEIKHSLSAPVAFTLNGLDQLSSSDEVIINEKITFSDATADATNGDAREKRQKKRSKMEQNAVEWLRTVEASDDVFAEAASSKFLTGNTCTVFPTTGTVDQLVPMHHELPTQSSPANFPSHHVDFDTTIPDATKRIIRRQTSSPPILDSHPPASSIGVTSSKLDA